MGGKIRNLILLFIVLVNGCMLKSQKDDDDPIDTNFGVLISSSEISDNCTDHTIDGVKYTICYDDSNKVRFKSTEDTGFSFESIKINMKLSEVINITNNKLIIERGWAAYVPLKGGWNAAFNLDPKKDYHELTQDSLVSFIFYRVY